MLFLANSPVSDFRPLAGMPLQEFPVYGSEEPRGLVTVARDEIEIPHLAATAVTDLTPLEGMPLQNVVLSQTKVSLDLSPITNAPIRASQPRHHTVHELCPARRVAA